MSTATRANIGELGIAIQSGEGSAAGTAAFKHPVTSGVIPKIVRDEANMEITVASGDLIPGRYVKEQHWELDANFWATERAIGPWLKAALGGLSTAGTADPYTHSLTNGTPGFITVFSNSPGTQYWKCADGTVNELNLGFEAGQPLMVNAKAMGRASTVGTSWTATVDDTPDSTGSWFTMIGAAFTFDEAATPASTSHTTVESGTIKIARGVEQQQTVALTPSHRGLGLLDVGVDFVMLFEDWKAYLATYTGAINGTTDSAAIVAGSFAVTFAQGPTASSNRTLTIALVNTRLMIPEPPEVDPGGGPFRVNVSGVCWKPSSGEIITATLKSSDSTF